MHPIFRPDRLAAGLALILAAGSASAAGHVVRVDTDAATLARVLGASTGGADYGHFQWLTVDDAALAHLRDAGIATVEIADPFVLDLGGVRFDPLREAPAVAGAWSADEAGDDVDGLRLVQFGGPIRRGDLAALAQAGVTPVQYIHPYTYVVWGTRAATRSVASRGAARWSGDFLPAYRVQPRWRTLSADTLATHVIVYRGAGDVAAGLRARGVLVDGERAIDRSFAVVNAHVPGSAFASIARIPGVYSIQPVPRDGGLRGEMSNQVSANNIGSGNLAVPGYRAYLDSIGVDGSGVIVADVDGGVYDTHPDLVARMLPCTGTTCGGSATDAHGTHTAGIIAADGSSGVLANGFLRGLGMAPGANLIEQLYDPTFTLPGGMLLLMTESSRNHAVLSGNSWGPAGSPLGYDGDTRQVDVGVRDADPDAAGDQPFHYVLSFMNGYGGTSSQGTPDEAKNVFTIGSTKMQSSSTVQYAAIDDLSSNSAHGPALDGRSIPAMVAPGCSVDSSASATGYQLMCGTSMASPHVAGASALFIEYYRNLSGVDPSPALIKAAFTAVAKNLTGNHDADGGTLTHLFDSKQGWGRMLLPPVLAPQQAVQYVDQTQVFDATGESWSHTYTADDPAQPIRIMLAWTDAPGHGLGGSTPAWNNDLDLRVTANGETFRGNVLDNAGWSTAGGTPDGRNNTEAVFLQPAQHGGSVTIDVLASNIASDGLPHAGDATDQDFALVCYNCADATSADADIGIAATMRARQVLRGQLVHYEVDVSNAGPAGGSAHVVAALSQLVEADATGPAGWDCAVVADGIACDHPASIPAGDTQRVTFSAVVAADAAGRIEASFSVAGGAPDSNTANNSAVVSTRVIDDGIFDDGFESMVP